MTMNGAVSMCGKTADDCFWLGTCWHLWMDGIMDTELSFPPVESRVKAYIYICNNRDSVSNVKLTCNSLT